MGFRPPQILPINSFEDWESAPAPQEWYLDYATAPIWVAGEKAYSNGLIWVKSKYDSAAPLPSASDFGVGVAQSGKEIAASDGAIWSAYRKKIEDVKRWFSLPFTERCQKIWNGSTEYIQGLYLLDAITVNGSTDVELQAALDIASTAPIAEVRQCKVVLLGNNITLSNDVTVPSNVVLISRTGFSISAANDKAIILSPGSTIACLDLNCQVKLSTAIGSSNAKVIGCRWSSAPVTASKSAIYDGRTGDNTFHKNMVIALNESVNAAEVFVWGQFICDSTIEYNKWSKSRGTGRALRMVGGIGNIIRYNLFSDGISGIGALLDRTQSIGWVGNAVYGNEIKNISEEGISTDCFGNIAAICAVYDRFTITATTGSWSSNPVLQFARSDETGLPTSHAYVALLVLTGSLAGRYLNVVQRNVVSAGVTYGYQLRNRHITAAELSALVGAEVALVIRCDQNIYRGNVLIDCYSPVKLWGSGWNTEISGNSCVHPSGLAHDTADIFLQGVGGLSPSSSTKNGQISIAPSNNRVFQNDAVAGFNGIAYSSQADVEDYISPLPNYVDGNSQAIIDEVWRRNSAPSWVGSEKPSSVTQGSSQFNPLMLGGDLFDDFSGKTSNIDRNNGTYTASGNGSATVFNIPHYLYPINSTSRAPTKYNVTPASSAAAASFYVTATSTHLVVTYLVAPASGTNNLSWSWSAET